MENKERFNSSMYKECNWLEMFKQMDCDPENNKYIANLHSLVSMELPPGKFSQKRKQLEEAESALSQQLQNCIKEEDIDKLREHFDLEFDIRAQVEKKVLFAVSAQLTAYSWNAAYDELRKAYTLTLK